MRLFLASYRFGADPGRYVALTGGPGRVAVIANAADAWPARARESAVVSDSVPLRSLGYHPEEVDLRDYVGATESLRRRLEGVDSVWVRGGNTFVLRARMALSGADRVLTDLVGSGALSYAGYSAGACVVTPSLRGLEFSDDPAEVAATCGTEVLWDGLGWVDHAIVPHAGGSDLDEGATRSIEYLTAEGIPFVALTDDEVLIVDDRL